MLEELRHRVDAVAEEDRQEIFADDQQGQRRHPFVGGDGEADRIARARHADDLLGRDIGRDQRGADRPPGQILRRQEIIRRVLGLAAFLARNPLGEAEDEDRVGDHHNHVDRRQAHGRPPPPPPPPPPAPPSLRMGGGAGREKGGPAGARRGGGGEGGWGKKMGGCGARISGRRPPRDRCRLLWSMDR